MQRNPHVASFFHNLCLILFAGGSGSRAGRRLIAVAAMLVGALVGSLLILHVSIVSPLVIALIVMAMVAVTARVLSSTDPAWVRAS